MKLTVLLEDWWREAKAAGRKPSTYEGYRNTVRTFVAFLRHDDARVTTEDALRFKDHRLASLHPQTGRPLKAGTVKHSDLSALKTVFGWGVANRKLKANPATGITIPLGKSVRLRSKSFTDAEAKAILAAASGVTHGSERYPETAAAKRWVPWLCAFTGARVGEMAQLRKQDLRREGNLWVLTITPEAGVVKTNEAREVVLHPQLVEQGFPEFVANSPPGTSGHLFLRPASVTGDVLGPLGPQEPASEVRPHGGPGQERCAQPRLAAPLQDERAVVLVPSPRVVPPGSIAMPAGAKTSDLGRSAMPRGVFYFIGIAAVIIVVMGFFDVVSCPGPTNTGLARMGW